ncbi:MAG TPA: single-stranded DNA-binding protein [Fimbriimonadaceae bacterium]|nr:single-stranded DNA-binding protein [Fimbriimonadaceae bacterium]
MVNRVVLVGRLTRDPELRTTTTGKNVCDFSIAVNKRIRPQDGSPDADFFRVVCWEKTAEYVSNYLSKGRLCAVDGRLQSRKYTANDGTNREVVEIVAESVQGLDRPREEGGGGGGSYSEGAPAAAAAAVSAPNVDEYDPFADE